MTFNNLQELIEQCKKDNACKEGIDWLLTLSSLDEALEAIPSEWWLWAILRNYTQFEKYLNLFNGNDWCSLLKYHPKFADQCTKYGGWKKFDGWDWSCLLEKQPQFADQCTKYGGWEKFDNCDWYSLLEKKPQLVDYRKEKN